MSTATMNLTPGTASAKWLSRRRIGAIYRKEVREYRRNANIVSAMVIFPMIFLIQPVVLILTQPSAAAGGLAHEHPLLYMLGIPALAPATLAAYAVVGERQQGTLEPVLTTPIRREEFLLGKALAALMPSVAVSYLVYGLFLAVVEIFAHPGIAAALVQAPEITAQIVFTPLLACWSIWLGIAISARCSEVRVAQQFGTLANLPTVVVTSLIAFSVIRPSLGLALAAAAVLLVLDALGWRAVSAIFDRERLITSTK